METPSPPSKILMPMICYAQPSQVHFSDFSGYSEMSDYNVLDYFLF